MADSRGAPPQEQFKPPPLKAPVAGGPFGQAGILIAGVGIVALGTTIAVLLASAQIRSIVILLLAVLGILSLSPKRGIYILLVFLPFMYYLRRQVLYFNEFATRDPILLFPPFISVVIFMGLLLFSSEKILPYLKQSTLMKVVVILLALFTAQVFNPLQGSILTGLAGGIYFITPMLWAFMGLALDEEDIRRILLLVIILGSVTAVYGIYQHVFGFTSVEVRELEAKGFLKILGTEARVMSTFAALGDFSIYLAVTGFLAFAHFWRNKANLTYVGVLVLVAFALLFAASRTLILTLVFCIVVFMILQSRRTSGLVFRGTIALLLVGGAYAWTYSVSSEQLYRSHGSSNPFVAHVVGGVAHPTQESTFKKRLIIWTYVTGRGLADQPLGRGLGSTTTAAEKFGLRERFEADSYFFEIIYGSSLVAAVLFIGVIGTFLRDALGLLKRNSSRFTYQVVTALVSGFFLSSVFGASIRDSISGPLAWLLIGWMAKEAVEDRTREEREAIPELVSLPAQPAT